MNIIEGENLSYDYVSFEKKSGFKGSLKDLFKREKITVNAVKNLNFTVEKGKIVGLLGANGAGKTTLIKLMTGILTPSSGKINCIGHTPMLREEKYLSRIGMMLGQKSQLVWDLPARDTLELLKMIYRINTSDFTERLEKLTEMLSLESKINIPVRKLSLGERIKFELICSVIHNPELLFLDEPTIGIDILSQNKIYDFLLEINRIYGTTIILTSHNTKDITALAKEVLIMKNGEFIYSGEVKELRILTDKDISYTLSTNKDINPYIGEKGKCERTGYCRYKLNVHSADELGNLNFKIVSSVQEDASDLDYILSTIYSGE